MTRIYLLGRVTVETADGLLEPSEFPGRQGRLAFVRLAAFPRPVTRDELADVLWPDELPDAWTSALSALASKLRKALSRVGLGDVLESGGGAYELRWPAGAWIDLREGVNALDRAEGALRRGDASAAWADVAVASAIFRRPFLPGERGRWVERMSEAIHEHRVRTFDTLAAAWILAGNPTAAVTAAREAVDLAPYRETCYARLMEAHLAAGNRAEALRTFERVRRMLAETLGIEPTDRIQRLYEAALG